MLGQLRQPQEQLGLRPPFNVMPAGNTNPSTFSPTLLLSSTTAFSYTASTVEHFQIICDLLHQPPSARPRGLGKARNISANLGETQAAKQYAVASARLLRSVTSQLSGPILFLTKLIDAWELDRESAAILLGFESTDRTFVSHVLDGHMALRGRDVKDRVAHLFEIRRTLSALFGNLEVENEWLREPHSQLDDQAPMDLLLEGSIENLLLVREYVLAAAGR